MLFGRLLVSELAAVLGGRKGQSGKKIFYISRNTRKKTPYGRFFSRSCKGLQPSAATVAPFGPNFVFFWRLFCWRSLAGCSWQVAGGSQ